MFSISFISNLSDYPTSLFSFLRLERTLCGFASLFTVSACQRSKENQSIFRNQIMKFKYWKLNLRQIICERFTPHFESNFWEAWTRIASSLSRVWASPAFTVIFLSKNNIDLFKAEKFYDHRRPLMFNVFTFKLHIVTQSHSIHLWDHISPYILFKLN